MEKTFQAPDVQIFWAEAKAAIGFHYDRDPDVWSFGDSPELAQELVELVWTGVKTATCGSQAAYHHWSIPVPKVGDLSVVLNGKEEPVCLIETTELVVQPFSAVTEKFAYDEGEGDRSYSYWAAAHRDYFSREAKETGVLVTDDMMLVCERFRCLYKRVSGP